MLRSQCVSLTLAAAAVIASGAETPHSSGKIIVFNVDGATNTLATSLNENGDVVGWFTDSNNAQHAFIRHGGGEIDTFDIPGGMYPTPTSINDVGEITGNVYVPDIGDTAGFFRDASGQATTFSVPGDVYGTFPVSLNKTGQILGYIVVNGFGSEGFIRDRSGTITVFDAPHSACNLGLARTKGPLGENDSSPCTYAASIDNNGEAVGMWGLNPNGGNTFYGYKRTTLGDIREFRVANSTFVQPTAINDLGWVTGSYVAGVTHGFIGGPNGSVTVFDAPDAASGTAPTGMNIWGVITGYYTGTDGIAHGFVRDRFGDFIEFDAPGAPFGTHPVAINRAGEVCGFLFPERFNFAAFIRQ